MTPDGGPAFPSGPQMTLNAAGTWPAMTLPQAGMTLRQWYAGMAASGFFANPNVVGKKPVPSDEVIAKAAFKFADAMIAEGEK